MIVFLTSSPTGPLDNSYTVNGVDEKNNFLGMLKRYWKDESRCLVISAFPADDEANDELPGGMACAMEKAGLSVGAFDVWDDRTTDYSVENLCSYDVVFLGGGHVPTENEFFHRIQLREKIQQFQGIIIGISAGTMNSADVVYAQPELPGEATDPKYQRFLKGLGITETNILPHYQMVRDWYLDGMRLYEEITFGDSYGKKFLVLVDGSYLMISCGSEVVYGEAYAISDGHMWKICEENQSVIWK